MFSTHSQYMIDSENLDRHIIVEKKDDITTLHKENSNAPFINDELLRRAIGSSIFECLKPKNIIFEGFLDKTLFQLYCKVHKIEKDFADVCETISTMEDFMDVEHIKTVLKELYPAYIYDLSKSAMHNIDKATNKDKNEKQVVYKY